MSEIRKIVADFQSVFAESHYPQSFLDAYDQMECLSSHTGRETFLVHRKSDGKLAIAKCYDRQTFSAIPDMTLLQNLNGNGIPKYYEQFRNEKTICFVREYIEGVPLNRYVQERHPDTTEIRGICLQLCDIIDILHSNNPPIIHRDIKPENIIIGTDGKITLIDFDIARIVKEDSEKDTISLGTRGYAPPEQYGFEQTDQKADIFSFGVLLRWLITGSVRPNPNIQIDPVLQGVINKCTEFSPEDRYTDIRQVRSELQAVHKRPAFITRKTAGLLAAASIIFLILGFVIGRNTDLFRPIPTVTPIIFSEPLIEEAVRKQLGMEDGSLLTQEALANVKVLYIYGTEAYTDAEIFFSQRPDGKTRGPIHTLSDLPKLPNLEQFYLYYQNYVDISALAAMDSLRTLVLQHLKLDNVDPIAEIVMLQHAGLFDIGQSNITPLENCHWLKTLDVGYNPITAIEQIGRHPFLESLILRGLNMQTLDGIETMTSLREVTLSKANILDLSALRKLPRLERIYVTAEIEADVRAIADEIGAEVILTND